MLLQGLGLFAHLPYDARRSAGVWKSSSYVQSVLWNQWLWARSLGHFGANVKKHQKRFFKKLENDQSSPFPVLRLLHIQNLSSNKFCQCLAQPSENMWKLNVDQCYLVHKGRLHKDPLARTCCSQRQIIVAAARWALSGPKRCDAWLQHGIRCLHVVWGISLGLNSCQSGEFWINFGEYCFTMFYPIFLVP